MSNQPDVLCPVCREPKKDGKHLSLSPLHDQESSTLCGHTADEYVRASLNRIQGYDQSIPTLAASCIFSELCTIFAIGVDFGRQQEEQSEGTP